MSTPVIYTTPGMEADATITLAQIGRWTLAGLGARDILRQDDEGVLQFTIGTTHAPRKVIVKLTHDDLYAIEIGRLNQAFDWVSLGYIDHIDADQLSDTIRHLAAEALT